MHQPTSTSPKRIQSRSASLADRRWCLSLAKSAYQDPVVGIDDAESEAAAKARYDLFDLITLDGRPVAYICAQVSRLQPHSKKRVMQLVYYHSTLSGISAAKTLVFAHDLMIEEARRRMLHACVTSSLNDNWQTMYRILVKHGWKSAGSIMYFEVK